MTAVRFLIYNAPARKKFLQMGEDTREVFFNGFKMGVIQSLRDSNADEINEVLTQLDADYNEVLASRFNASKSGARKSS
jgi:hypothetical protein